MFIFNLRALLMCSLAVFSAAIHASAEPLAIVVNVNNKLESATSAELERYFKAEKSKTPEGLKIVLAMQEPGRVEREAVLKDIYKMSETEYTNFFVEATFTGAVSSAPKSFASPAAIKKFVAATPGAISYLRASDLDSSVKALKINGKAFGDSDYPLQLK